MLKRIHSFHIPVMGLAFTIDSPIKIAKYGITSVVSLGDDVLIEDMRKYYSSKYALKFEPIIKYEEDYRARRITAYLDMLHEIVEEQFKNLKKSGFEHESELVKYLQLLPEYSPIKSAYETLQHTTDNDTINTLKEYILSAIEPGNIDVNIMAKVDGMTQDKHGNDMPPEYSIASSALRGFAKSKLNASLIISAGFNPRLYSYICNFKDFFPDENGAISKRITLKVSDFRSARIQGQFLAKKGIFVSEFRIESGLNCGGHAFPTEGFLLGPILEEFKNNKEKLAQDLFEICAKVWKEKQLPAHHIPKLDISVQGGIGTAKEQQFLLDYYKMDSIGWGTPFLLVPEVTNVDPQTLQSLSVAKPEQLFLSEASPLGVPFNNFKLSASEVQRKRRIASGRPGSPCLKKYLLSNTNYSKAPICTASRQFLHHSIKELEQKHLSQEEYQSAYDSLTAKECLCEDLAAPAYINAGIKTIIEPTTAVCPGPNLAFFSGIFTLKQMVDHIYGRTDLLNTDKRPNLFVNELKLYIDYLKKEVEKVLINHSLKPNSYFTTFINNLQEGIQYYKNLIPKIKLETAEYLQRMQEDIIALETRLSEIQLPSPMVVVA